MSKGGAGKACKKRITFDKAAVVENRKIKNTHAEHYVTGTDVIKSAVCKSTAIELFV